MTRLNESDGVVEGLENLERTMMNPRSQSQL